MGGIQATRNEARRDLHHTMAVPALYVASDGIPPLPVSVRVHTKQVTGGADHEGNVERRDISPRIVFLRTEVPMPARNAIVSIAAGEAYRLGEASPADGITITVSASRIPIDKTVGLPLPPEDDA